MNATPPILADTVRASRLATGLDDAQVAVLAERVSLQALSKGQVLAPEGSADNRLYVIVEGSIAVVKGHATPGEEVLVTLHAGDFVHELGFLDGAPRYASLVAASDGRVLVLEREALEGLIESHPRIVYAVMCNIVRAVHQVQTRLAVQASELTNYIVKQHGRY
ncbi:cyclic nucleotide-binding domain-containing protein [Azohydromonas sediminis]|uniref:cyclic nucleotide-binding domain-containing protein n=1 Tax=Azohydromonas sediminis TaxID=2259674 RepID=UPI000E651304|nr:cyclic nucleotide-binding domain-containing protein [Azohydromonas sediminis]